MHLVCYTSTTPAARIGVSVDGGVVDLVAGGMPSDIVELVALGDAGVESASQLAATSPPISLDLPGKRPRRRNGACDGVRVMSCRTAFRPGC